jgi:hypothetical protein
LASTWACWSSSATIRHQYRVSGLSSDMRSKRTDIRRGGRGPS